MSHVYESNFFQPYQYFKKFIVCHLLANDNFNSITLQVGGYHSYLLCMIRS